MSSPRASPSSATRTVGTAAVHVVAGVLLDARGRVLLARRTAGRDLAGAWEFPGGKVEKGETSFQALDRELHEELGIRIHAIEPLISVPQAYAHKRIVLEVHRVTRFSGKPQGLEHQALAWSPADKLATYPMPSADRPVVAALTEPAHYLVTPPEVADANDYLSRLERALSSGIKRVQLRVLSTSGTSLAELLPRAKEVCDAAGAELLVNGDIELARRSGCGVHLRSTQLLGLDRRPLPTQMRVAASCHDAAELAQAESIGADFAVLGPVEATASHAGHEAMGWARFAMLRENVSLPIYALGGMQRDHQTMARSHGAQGIAGISGLWPQ